MTREEFFDALRLADWYYAMSDSNEVFARGSNQMCALRAEARTDAEKKRMYSEFANYYNGTRNTQPAREEFDL